MSDTALYHKVKLLLDRLDQVFHQEWDDTKKRLGSSGCSEYIDDQGTFLEPEFEDPLASWSSRDDLLRAYQGAVVALMRVERRITNAQSVKPQVENRVSSSSDLNSIGDKSSTVSVFPATIPKREEELVKEATPPIEKASIPVKPDQVKPVVNATALPKVEPAAKVNATALPKVESVAKPNNERDLAATADSNPVDDELGMIEPRARPDLEEIEAVKTKEKKVEVKEEASPTKTIPKPSSGPLGFPSPFSSPATRKPAGVPMTKDSVSSVKSPLKVKAENIQPGKVQLMNKQPAVSVNTGKVVFGTDSSENDEQAVREKFAYLLEGVEHEKIRDFILADGANTKTGKPSMLIYIPAAIWLEFAFDLEEGRRILNKYPQRDPELIEFMKSTGNSK